MHLQVRILAAMLLLAALSIGTGTVLLLGYLLAAFSIGVIIFIMARKMVKRIADPRWTGENRQFVDRAKPAISRSGRDQ